MSAMPRQPTYGQIIQTNFFYMDLKEAVNHLDGRINEWKDRTEAAEQELKELKAKGGRSHFTITSESKGLRNLILNGIHRGLQERKAEIGDSTDGQLMKPVEIKTVQNIASANLTVDTFQSYLDWRPGMEPTGQFHFRNLVRTILSETDFVQFPRANTPTGEGSFGRQTEGNTKAQIDRDYTMITATLKPMAAYTIASRQSLRNIVFLQSWLPESMMNQLEESEDDDFANALVAAATGVTTTTKTLLPEKLITYMKTLIKSKYNPTAIAVDPDVWEDLLTFRPTSGDVGYSLPGPVTVGADGNIRLLNRPVVPVNWLTGRRVIVGDFTKAAIVQSEGLRLRQSDSHASIFTSNEIAFLLERTENLVVFRPNAFITTTV
jgi:hypothetical protein